MSEVKSIMWASLKYGWQEHSVKLLLVVSLIENLITTWGFYSWQTYLPLLQWPQFAQLPESLHTFCTSPIWITGNQPVSALRKKNNFAFVANLNGLLSLSLSHTS